MSTSKYPDTAERTKTLEHQGNAKSKRILAVEDNRLGLMLLSQREIPVGAGRMRGLILHKLMEEVLTGELAEDLSAFVHRAGELLIDLPIDATSEGTLPAAEEIASTTWNTLHLAEIVALRSKLVPELPLYAMLSGESDQLALAGRADAIAFDHGLASVVLDWKSDIAPTSQDIRTHTNQLQHYMMAIGAPRGALVYMTPGTVHWVGATTTAA